MSEVGSVAEELQLLFRPKIQHFVPLEDGRDQFGNRVFSTRKEGLHAPGYLDKEGGKHLATLLVSPEGERFIKDNPGLLGNIDHGIAAINTGKFDLDFQSEPDGSMHKIFKSTAGAKLAELRLGRTHKKYFLKWLKQKDLLDKSHGYQPLINEMLQVQEIKKAFSGKLLQKDINIVLPTYLFASGFFLCRDYEAGYPPSPTPEIVERINKAIKVLWNYVYARSDTKGSLWKNITFDTADFLIGRHIRTDNFILRPAPDNTLVWIDPFAHIA